MKRRDFILGLGGAVLCSEAAQGQQTSPTVGVLAEGTEQSARSGFASIKARLAEMGYVEGRNLAVEYRWGDFRQERLADLARALDERQVAAIVTFGGPATVAAKSVTTSTPIIFYTGFDPVVSGYVKSLNQPGGNVTGVYILNSQLIIKRLEILHELVPTAKKIAFFYTDTGDPKANLYADQILKAADRIGIEMLPLSASHVDEIEGLFARAGSEHA